MIELVYDKGRMKLPESFEELSGKQFIQLASMMYAGGEEIKCKVRALKILTGMSAFCFAMLKAEVISNAIEFVDWVFKREKEEEIKHFTKQLVPVYKHYHGPASGFDNLRMKEFHLSEMYYREIVNDDENEPQRSQRTQRLDNLVAVLYRRAKKNYDVQRDPDGDIRVDFNHNEVPYHAKKIARWPLNVKQAIFIWYDGCRQQLIDDNPMVYKELSNSDFESQFDTGLYGVMRSLAGEKLGSVKAIEEMYVHTAMLEIGLIKEEEKYIEEKMKTAS